jgi:hypothetical protein
VAFESAEAPAACLSRVLRDDCESLRPKLYWAWRVEGCFNQDHQLRYRLRTAKPARPWFRWARWWMDQDLQRMPTLLSDSL